MRTSSEFERMAVGVLNCLVDGQKAKLVDGEGNKWDSVCKSDGDGTTTFLNTTKIFKNGDLFAIALYFHRDGTEKVHILCDEGD